MRDQYDAEPGTAACPRCGLSTEGAPLNHGALRLAALSWHCPACSQDWDELRKDSQITRYWEVLGASPVSSRG